MLIPLTPAAVLPTHFTSVSLNLMVLPALEKSIISFVPSVMLTSIKLSPSFKFMAINPEGLGLENSVNLVFLIMVSIFVVVDLGYFTKTIKY